MQTFIPDPDPIKIARILDRRRVFNQINEGKVLLDLHEGRTDNSWKNHPAFKMWIGQANALRYYINCMIMECIKNRGIKTNYLLYDTEEFETLPDFFTDVRVLTSHRSNLMRKDPDFYGKFGWHDYGINGYYWPCEVKSARAKKINKQWDEICYGKR